MKIRKFALKLEIPKSMVHEIVHDTLGYQKVSRRRVIVISICKMYGGVFMTCPESYVITRDVTSSSKNIFTSRKLEFDEWKTELLSQSRDIKGLRTRFIKLNLMTPQSRLVFSLPHTLQASRQKVLHMSSSFNIHPRNTLHFIKNEVVRTGLRSICEEFIGEDHLVLSLDTWSLEIDFAAKPDTVGACVAVFSAVRGLHVIAIATSVSQSKTEWNFVVNLAIKLKQILVQHGGCNRHLGFKCHVVDVSIPSSLEAFKHSSVQDIYPSTFTVQGEMMNDILNALTISVASYKPFSHSSSNYETEHYFLLTCDQLELLWTHHLTKELWVHGPPGCGKTIAALEMMRILRQRGCAQNELLYVAENLLLCAYVRSFDLGLVVNRRELMQDYTDINIFSQKYGEVKNVVVDEAQNFKDRDGDWYILLEKLAQQNCKSSLEVNSGYFWVFMDYAQKVHKFSAGLPNVIGKNNFILREISRNSQEIYTYARKFMDAPSEGSPDSDGFPGCLPDSAYHLGHDYCSGNQVNVVKCSKTSMETILGQILKQCVVQEGRDLKDVAVLASKKMEAKTIKQNLKGSSLERVNNNPRGVDENSIFPSNSSVFQYASKDSSECSAGQVYISDSGKEGGLKGAASLEVIKDAENNPTEIDSETPSGLSSGNSSLLISSVKEFSGLDRPVIIGVEPHTNQRHADLDKFLLNLVTRAKDQLIILTTSDELMKKLSVHR
ncbi:schlafen family member 13 [Elysia marginata]|uniref:Schlafen family member 13 n=1 Tax=Elysia marginata TaxID=1093978 RepID=A0AAV4EX82_9GAST|nr:schlafen family member 13 [Elysia marginata]